MSDAAPVVVSLLPHGELAERIATAIGGRADLKGRDFDDVGSHLRALFSAGRPVVGIAAAGILIRCLAPLLGDKTAEPPVLAVAPDGSAVVPLLGGHRGANALARRIAQALGTAAAVTTAGDVALGVALDEPPDGWRLENPEDAKPVMAALLAGARGQLSGDAPWLAPLAQQGAVDVLPADPEAPVVLSVAGAAPLIYRRRSFALGVGCARGCDPDEMIALVGKALAEAGIAAGEIAAVHSIDLKADEAAIHALAAHLGVPARFHTPARLEEEAPRLANPSEVVFAEVGCHGVAEGAALAAAGPGGSLELAKTKTANATCAVARITPGGAEGQPRGHLAVVGIGPGQADWRTPEATRLIAEADELVGYGFYIDLLGPEARGRMRRDFALGEEEARCRYALEAAGEGRRVALICSGDGGIYAMGALVMELLDRPEDAGGVTAAAKRVAVTHAPGISALQAASARAGALLGHDFCAISLSDLLTPRDTILQRLDAAARGDFVIAFYNPVSRRRRTLLAQARDILLAHRPDDTPVLLARSLGRPDEDLTLRRLADLDVDEVDMMTIVLVGASASRRIQSGDIAAGAGGTWIYTPRGYAKRIDGESA
ncbi:precorrin-3B C(17)-methyltransferase [Tropicimonas isoalkanivorans]|uniref:Cobalt-precorrin 5A hydrolase / precorrin-3B C17-methyltransferase n=1 Tax=Tropicimonas isoalkanivorans TaxID=441112 RepID=A0A1I1LD42_9RHOB|nr:precorrin-3B C(17)-methyltransferase [Tropicimonas isoalkanivorans]SFC70906.1 cobalt-precorrin 5A hydrolase / precorrin-3B C17-methyltransferase [Tropicimonas isoalkanivorans]